MDRLVASFGEKTSWSVRGRSLTLIGWGGPWGEVYRGIAPREPRASRGPIVRISVRWLCGHAMLRSLAPIDFRLQTLGLGCNRSDPKEQPPRSEDRGGCKNQEQVRGIRSEADLKLRTKEHLATRRLGAIAPPTGVATTASTEAVGE